MFTGGDQLRLLDILMGTEFVAELRRRGREGLVVGGSSAGSMALGDPVIVRGDPTAFYEDGRHPAARPASASSRASPSTRTSWCAAVCGAWWRWSPPTRTSIGLGIDEDCGLEISPDGVATVMGRGVVCVRGRPRRGAAPAVAGHGRALSVSGLTLHVLADGDRYDLRARRVRRG